MLAQDIDKLKAEFGDREFNGRDVARVLGMKTWHGSGTILKSLRRREMIYQTVNGWRFGTLPVAPVKAVSAPVVPDLEIAPLRATPALVRIGELYLHERLILAVSVAFQEASPAVRIYTPIIEVDPATRHPRSKVINFIKSHEPREYAAALAWLDSMAGNAPAAADDTALELAAELERKLNAALEERDEYKRKLDAIRGAL